MQSPKSSCLLLQAEKVLPQPAHPHLIACCPTMDLVAVVNQEEQLHVYRFGGQRALSLHRSGTVFKVISLCWKFNGQYLAVGWSDGVVQVVSTETGNVLQHFKQVTKSSAKPSTSNEDASKSISCIGWGMNFIDVAAVKSKTGSATKKSIPIQTLQSALSQLTTDIWDEESDLASLDDFLERIPDPKKVEIPVNLPTQLARIDVASLLPRLPALPSSAAELFTSQASLDNALHTASDRDLNGLETLLLCHNDGTVHLILYDSLSLGDVDSPTSWNFPCFNYILHASHPFACSHMLLTELPSQINDKLSKIALIPLSLRFLHSAGSHLHMIESRTAQLETLVQYVGETIRTLNHHWKHANTIPDRFKGLVNEMLAEKEEPTLVQSLFHLSVTGDCPPTLKEWLIDNLAERGRQRWDEHLSKGYAAVIALTHENLLPALDRCSIIITNLQGLAQYHEHSPVFNVPIPSFTVILNIIRTMRFLCHQLLIYASTEQRQFATFSRWLKHEIDVQATDPNSANAEETAERDLGIDYGLLLGYLQGALEESKVDAFVVGGESVGEVGTEREMYNDVKKSLHSLRKGEECDTRILRLQGHFDEWKKCNRTLVDQITSHQRSSSFMNCGIVVEDGGLTAKDMRMVYEGLNEGAQEKGMSGIKENDITTYCAFVKHDSLNEVRMFRVIHSDTFDEYKAVRGMQAATLQFRFRPDFEIRDIKFIDDAEMMLLIKTSETSNLITIPYRPLAKSSPSSPIQYECLDGITSRNHLPHGEPLTVKAYIDITEEMMTSFTKHTFFAEDRFKPLRIEVNGRRSRRFVTVIAEDLRYLRIFDLDFREEAEDGVGAGAERRRRQDEDSDMLD